MRRPAEPAAWLAAALAVGLLAACGSGAQASGDLADALVVELPGYVAAAAGPTPETLCDGEPSGTGPTPPALPGALGTPVAAFYESGPATLEAFAWPASADAVQAADPEADPASDAEAARQIVDAATAAAHSCRFELFTDADTDGDGRIDTGGSDIQSVEPWSGAGWAGVRIHRVVSGGQQTERRLVHAGDVVLLVVLRADSDAPESLAPADDFLQAVAEHLG